MYFNYHVVFLMCKIFNCKNYEISTFDVGKETGKFDGKKLVKSCKLDTDYF